MAWWLEWLALAICQTFHEIRNRLSDTHLMIWYLYIRSSSHQVDETKYLRLREWTARHLGLFILALYTVECSKWYIRCSDFSSSLDVPTWQMSSGACWRVPVWYTRLDASEKLEVGLGGALGLLLRNLVLPASFIYGNSSNMHSSPRRKHFDSWLGRASQWVTRITFWDISFSGNPRASSCIMHTS